MKTTQSHPAMKLTETLTDEMVDEMILETDVDETHCPQQLANVSVLQIAENRGSCHSIPRGADPRTNHCTDL